jgi:Bacterial Ig-like domain
MTPITHTPAPLTDPVIYPTDKTVIIEISVEKTGWIYIDVTDKYPLEEFPQYTLTVKAGNRTISSDRIWRMNGKIYILDDPVTSYDLIYGYTILPPTFYPVNGTTLTVERPAITIYYLQAVTIVSALLDAQNIAAQFTTTDNKIFTYTPTTDLTEGTHTLSLTVEDDQGNTLTSASTYTVTLEKPAFEFPWLIVLVIAIIIIIVGLIIYYLRSKAFI